MASYVDAMRGNMAAALGRRGTSPIAPAAGQGARPVDGR